MGGTAADVKADTILYVSDVTALITLIALIALILA